MINNLRAMRIKLSIIIPLLFIGSLVFGQYTHTTGSVNTCTGTYTDPQGAGGYTDFNGSQTYTICSGTSDPVQVDFTAFETREAADNLAIYDGPTTGSTLIGTYSGTTSPGTVTATGTCLTFVWTTDANQDGDPGWSANISCILPDPDDCGSAIDLASISSPYSNTTTGAANDFSDCSMGSAEDHIFYIDVPVGSTFELTQTSNDYDSRQTLRYGGACPGTTQIECVDDPEFDTYSWQNCTGSAQRVYYIQSGYSAADGNYTFEWSLTAGSCPANPDDCGSSVDLATLTSPYSSSTSGVNNDFSSCGGSAGDHIYYMDVPVGSTFEIQQTLNNFDSEQSLTYGGACPGSTTLFCSDSDYATFTWQNCTGSTQRVYWINDGYSTGEGTYTFEWSLTAGTCPVNPDDCGSSVDLATLTSPYSNSTVGDNNDFSTCGGSAGDHIYYMDVPVGSTFEIQQTTNSFDSQQSLTYGGACPGSTTLYCTDSDLATFTWQNCTGSTQRVYWINDGYSTGEGSYTFEWSLTAGSCPVAPANDLCANATALPCGTTNLAGTTVNSTNTPHGTSCSISNYGVWYTFTGDGNLNNITVDPAAGYDTEVSVSTGSCGTFTNVDCDDSGGSGSVDASSISTVNGTTYYVYVAYYGASGGSSNTGAFTISRECVGPPANDECGGATALTVNADLNCGVVTSSTITGATESADANSCGGTDDDDVWFSFVATSTLHQIELSNVSGTVSDMYHAVFTGTCGSLGGALECSDNNTSIVSGLTIGQTYFVRVYTYTSTGGQDVDFDICVGTPPPPPSNNDCSSATTLPCGTTNLAGTTVNTTDDTHGTGCFMSNYGVWYTFVGNGQQTTVSVNSTFDAEIAVAYGSCGALTNLSCTDSGNPETYTFITTNGLTYYVYVAHYSSSSSTTGTFTISRSCTAAPVCTPDMTINTTTYSNTGLTTCGFGDDFSSSDACGSSYMNGDDIVIAYTPTSSECVNINLSNTGSYTGVFVTNSCPDFAGTVCLQSATSWDGDPSINSFSVTSGTTYYITVSTSPSPQCTAFDLDIELCPPAPANDDCGGAIGLTVNPSQVCATSTAGTITSATASTDANTCSGTDDDDVWYSFVATHTTHFVDLDNVSGSVTDMYHSVYTGTCGSLGAELICSDANSSTLSGLSIGQTYYVRVYTYTSTPGQNVDFDICVTSPNPPPPNDACVNAIALTMNGETCVTTTSGYTENGTSSLVGCTGTAHDDVWYTFVATATSHDLSLINATGTTDLVHEVFSGTCGSLTSLNCSDPNSSTVSGLTIGDTYYVRVYTYSGSGVNTGFELCITGPCIDDPTPSCNLGYTMTTISNSTYNYNTGVDLTFSDDRFADNFSTIGFDFCFDGVKYSNCMVSSNGYVTFEHCLTEIPDGNLTTAGYSPYSISDAIPNDTDAPTNSIMLWHDIDPSKGGDVRTQLHGTAPNRVFVVKYDDVAMYSCNSDLFSAQIMLYETTNDIEIHVTEKNTCGSWNGSDAIMGLNNYDGTLAVTDAGHNYPTDWTENNTAYRFAFSCPTCVSIILPVEMLYFDGYAENNHNVLNWTTASESNSKKFVVEKSMNGGAFYVIGEVEAAGQSNQNIEYSFVDTDVANTSKSFYRLRQVDFDGQKAYSDVIAINRSFSTFEIDVAPNPTKGIFDLSINSWEEELVTIEIIDYAGRIISSDLYEVNEGRTKHSLNIETLNAGIYFVKITNEEGIYSLKKIIKK